MNKNSEILKFLLIVIVSIIIIETLIMLIFNFLLPHYFSNKIEIFIDAITLIFFLLPVIYFFLYRPMQRSLQKSFESENNLKKSNERYDSIIKTSLDGFWIVSNEGHLLDVNDAYCKMIGYSRDKLLTMNVPDLEALETDDITHKHIEKIIGQGWDRFITKHRCANGKIIDVEISVNYIPSQELLLVFINNITQRKQQEEVIKKSEEKFRLLFNIIPDAIIIHDAGYILQVNNIACERYGYSKEELLKMTINNINSPKFDNIIKELKIQLLETGKTIIETEHMNRNGEIIPTEISSCIIEYGDKSAILCVARDITERKHYEKVLHQANQKLTELNLTKDKFFSIIAHDLKNPFAGLLSSCELLKRSIIKQDMIKIEKYTDSIYNSSKIAYTLLENLLDWSRLQMGRCIVQKEKFNIHSVIINAITSVQNIASTKEIEIIVTVDDKVFVFFDIEMFKTIIRNFTTNAIKFSIKGDKVVVEITEYNEKYYKVSVKDYGVGISKENLTKLFSINYSQTSYGTANEKGTGLGLILCKEFVEKNNSEIFVESDEGKGSTFSFTVEKYIAI